MRDQRKHDDDSASEQNPNGIAIDYVIIVAGAVVILAMVIKAVIEHL